MIERGAKAPSFRLPDQNGDTVSLEDLAGRRILLVFYPADFSPACTDQLSLYQPHLEGLADRGVSLYGVSVDSSWCHRAFREHLGVTMPLLADFHPKGEVAKAYGLWADDYGVAIRALVLIGEDGTVEWSHRPRSPLEVPSAELILGALDELAA
jgi:peroxiredoxin